MQRLPLQTPLPSSCAVSGCSLGSLLSLLPCSLLCLWGWPLEAPVFPGSPRHLPEAQMEAPAAWSFYSSLAPPPSLAQFNPNPFVPQTPRLPANSSSRGHWSPASALRSLPPQRLSVPPRHQAFLRPRAFAHAVLSVENFSPPSLGLTKYRGSFHPSAHKLGGRNHDSCHCSHKSLLAHVTEKHWSVSFRHGSIQVLKHYYQNTACLSCCTSSCVSLMPSQALPAPTPSMCLIPCPLSKSSRVSYVTCPSQKVTGPGDSGS